MPYVTKILFDDGDDDNDNDDVVTAAARDGQPAEVAQRHVQLNSHSVTHSSTAVGQHCQPHAVTVLSFIYNWCCY